MQFELNPNPKERNFIGTLNGETNREITGICAALSILMIGEPKIVEDENGVKRIHGRLASGEGLAEVMGIVESTMDILPSNDRSTTDPFDYRLMNQG